MTKTIRNVFQTLAHAIETNLVDPKEQYQAVLLGDPVARHSHGGELDSHSKARVPHLVGEERLRQRLNRAA